MTDDQPTDRRDGSRTVADNQDEFEDIDAVDSLASFSGSYKVLGELSDPNGAAGVVGRNTASSGATYGVVGETESDQSGAAGVVGATSGTNIGVEGRTYNTLSNLGSMSSLESAGVFGRNDKSSGFGVLGWSRNHHGILGRSDDSDHAGVLAYNSTGDTALRSKGDAYVAGSMTVTGSETVRGSQSVTDNGVEVYLNNAQTIASGRTRTQIEFDSVVQDDFGNWDGTNYWYTIPEDGTYQVSAQTLCRLVPDGTLVEIRVSVNDTDRINVNASGTDTIVASKTLFGLSAGDTITVDAAQSDSDSHDLGSGRNITFLTVAKIG